MKAASRIAAMTAVGIVSALISIYLSACSSKDSEELKKIVDERAVTARNLATFDTLDFTVFTHQEWERLHESHSKDIKVHWPDGHVTEGIDVHINDLKAMFVYAPDTRIRQHPIRFGDGKYTAVTGVFEGTFTQPMPFANGQAIQPTGKPFSLPMVTIGVWDNGVMTEEYLFWDNQTFMKQVGLAK